MRKVILFIAMSLDGYIADQYGKVDWLAGLDRQKDAIDTFEEFVKKNRYCYYGVENLSSNYNGIITRTLGLS